MTEGEILSIRNELIALVVSVVSVSFGMISAYIVGLWLFLKKAPVVLRLLAFLLLSCGLAFMGVLTGGLNALLLGTERAWSKLDKTSVEIPSFGSERPDFLYGLSLYEASAALGCVAFLAIYAALFFITFFYRWADETEPD
ncbi:hypothetical protein [Hyphomicrobium sp. LHD-15]|uniref:hypothetical protein n=1 Tax=Hyphomicrobium sp. LHD-15 TaxID=3072142 RepID=UPI00280F49CB|nr:hypothetical protein [Hyphomicrobium sp. LHD-15]MDQ8698004.1 hypothetical protein [Hyphomicrobium sp. LHD-15]